VRIMSVTALVCSAAAVMLAMPSSVAAQDVQYETVTKLDMPGAMGTAMRLAARMGGGSTETVETTYIKGRRMRTDSDDSSTIIDLEAGRFITLDHKAKTYVSMTFDEMLELTRAQAEQLKSGVREEGPADAESQVNFRFAVDATNERQQISGYNAARVFLTMEAEGEFTPEGETRREQAGTLVVLTDMWTSKDVPAFAALSTFNDASAQRFATQGSAMAEAMAAAFAGQPNMKVAFEQSAEQARKVDGMPIRTVTRFISVAHGQKFDRAMATDPKPEAGPGVAQQAGRAALGRLGRAAAAAAGGRQQQQQQAEPGQAQAEMTQATLMTVTSEVRNISSRTLDAALFEVPAGYRAVSLDAGR
jgi:hypothetical protein